MQMRAEDLMSPGDDKFWDVLFRERAEEETLQRQCLVLQAQIDVRRRVEAIRHATGFQEFLQAVKSLHALAREALVGDDRLTDAGLRETRGKVRGLESVLALLTSPQIDETLARQLQERKNLLAEALRRRPKPKTEDPQVQP